MDKVYLYDLPQGQRGPWRVANVLADPLYWYIINIRTGEQMRLGLYSLMDYTQALAEAEKMSAEAAGLPGTEIHGTKVDGTKVEGVTISP